MKVSSGKENLATANNSPCQYHHGGALLIENFSLAHGGRVLFRSSDLCLKHGRVTGLVGINGAGKTSLAKVLASKQIEGFPSHLRVQYLSASDSSLDKVQLMQTPVEYIQSQVHQRLDQVQEQIDELEHDIDRNSFPEEMLEDATNRLSDLYDLQETLSDRIQVEMDDAVAQIGLVEHMHKSLSALSSGWRYKCQLVSTLLVHPELLIVDEPSYLDETAIEWLVSQLNRTAQTDKAMVLLISHKESLLETVCDEILYINAANQTLTLYHCSYSTFRATHEAELQSAARTISSTQEKAQVAEQSLKKVQSQLKKREQNTKTLTTQNADQRFIKGKSKESKQKADKSAAAKLRQSKRDLEQLESMKRAAQREQVKPLHIDGMPADGTVAVSLHGVGVAYDGGWVFRNVETSMETTDRILLTGPNGCGKSTLVKVILGEMEPTEGHVVRKGTYLYFPQTCLSSLISENGSQIAKDFLGDNMTETMARTVLGAFGVAGDLALHPIASLSAGQRVRLWLAKQLQHHPTPSLLVLDEISENVDIETRDSLIEMMATFGGAVLMVSHDPDFCSAFNYTKTWNLGPRGVKVSFAD
eukprot:Clim_evm20s84 gene=Clim_evmTU20s84